MTHAGSSLMSPHPIHKKRSHVYSSDTLEYETASMTALPRAAWPVSSLWLPNYKEHCQTFQVATWVTPPPVPTHMGVRTHWVQRGQRLTA